MGLLNRRKINFEWPFVISFLSDKLLLVQFTVKDGGHHDMVICGEEWMMEMQASDIVGAQVQILLCLAWLLSIHKSQGQTIPYVQVDLRQVFEKDDIFGKPL